MPYWQLFCLQWTEVWLVPLICYLGHQVCHTSTSLRRPISFGLLAKACMQAAHVMHMQVSAYALLPLMLLRYQLCYTATILLLLACYPSMHANSTCKCLAILEAVLLAMNSGLNWSVLVALDGMYTASACRHCVLVTKLVWSYCHQQTCMHE